MPERDWPTDEQLVDLMIDLMAELEGIELSARHMRERLSVISTRMHMRWMSKMLRDSA